LKHGSDTVGITLGLLTVPMALLSISSVAAGLILMWWQDWLSLVFGVATFLICSIFARLLEQMVIAIDDAAAHALQLRHRRRAYAIAVVSGAFPVLVIYAAEIGAFHGVLAYPSPAPIALQWLWAYGVATAPWSLYAERVSRFRRTLVGLRAYAGHVALWLFLLLTLGLHAPPVLVVVVLLAPAILPFTLGMTLALADREAIANVRV
jgi:hypothetical protein